MLGIASLLSLLFSVLHVVTSVSYSWSSSIPETISRMNFICFSFADIFVSLRNPAPLTSIELFPTPSLGLDNVGISIFIALIIYFAV